MTRIEMSKRGNSLRWLRLTTLSAALSALLFVGVGLSLWHVHAPGSDAENTCPICHVAHIPILPGAPVAVRVVPLALSWLLPAKAQTAHLAPIVTTPPSRAPPA